MFIAGAYFQGSTNPGVCICLLSSASASDEDSAKMASDIVVFAVVLHMWIPHHANRLRRNKHGAAQTLSYWCMSPGLALNELACMGSRSLILTSGS